MSISEGPASFRNGHAAGTPAGRRELFSRGVEAGLWALLIATPLALGSVSRTATALMEGTCFILFVLAWWGGPRPGSSPVPRVLKVLAGLFLSWSLLQVIPLPPAVLDVVSPGTSRLYSRYSPGYSGGKESVDLQAWLLGRKDTSSRSLAPRAEHPTGFEGKLLVRQGWKPISWFPGSTLLWVSRIVAYWALFLLVAEYLPERACRKRLPWLLLLLGGAIAVEGMIQHLAWNGKIFWIIPVYQGYPFGPWVNNNHFSGYLEMVLPVGAALLFQAGGWNPRRRRRRRHSRQHLVPRLLVVVFSLACILAALATARSRGGLFSLLLASVLYLSLQVTSGEWKARRPRLAVATALLLLLIVVAGVAAYTLHSSSGRAQGEAGLEPSFSSRVQAWKGVFQMIAANPISGTGLGTFSPAYPVFKTYGSTAIWEQAHNDYLQLLAESGAVGFVLLLGGMGWFLRRHVLPVLSGPWRRQEPVALGASLGVVTLLFHALVDFNLQIPSNGLLFVLLGGLVVRFGGRSGTDGDGGRGPEDSSGSEA